MEETIDFYSNDLQIDLQVEATLVSYGEYLEKPDYLDVLSDPKYRIESIQDYEGIPHKLSDEETRRVHEILNNIYWSRIN